MKNWKSTAAVAVFALGLATQSNAGILFNVEDPANQSNTAVPLSFTATASSTDIIFAGYNVPSWLNVTQITLSTGGGPNLLGQVWNFTAAPSGSDTSQFDDGLGTGTNGLAFGSVVEDSFDQYDQVIATTIGQTYDLNFLLSNSSTPSELMVSTSDVSTADAAPEPGTTALLLGGMGMLAFRRLRRKA